MIAVRMATDGVEGADPDQLRALLPSGLLLLVAAGANLLLIVLVSYVVLRTLFTGRRRSLARPVAAGIAAYTLASLINATLFALIGPERFPDALAPDDVFTSATLGYVAAVLAFIRTMPTGLPRVRSVLWAGNTTVAVCALLAGVTSFLALVLTVLVGLTCAALVRYALGERPPPQTDNGLDAELRRFGLAATGVSRAADDEEGNPRHLAELDDGRRVELVVLSSENTAGFWRRLRDLLFLRGPVAPRMLYGVRRRAEHAALMSFSARQAGAAVPRVLAVGELGPGTVLLVRELPAFRPLDALGDEELTDGLTDLCWRELGLLHRHRLVHGNVNGATVGVLDHPPGAADLSAAEGTPTSTDDSTPTGASVPEDTAEPADASEAAAPPVPADPRESAVLLTGLDRGGVAAPQLQVSLDQAAMLTLLAMRVGTGRAVDSAVRALGVTATAAILPFLQPAGLPYALRRGLRGDRGLLARLRERVVRIAPEAPSEPARLERMRPRTVVSVIVATVVGLVLLYQLTGVDFTAIGRADPVWTLAALAASVVCTLSAAMILIGFVPVPLPWWRTVMVQYAGSFVRIAAPAGLGSLAINTRFVTREGVSTSLALSAVGLTQLVGFLVHVPLLLVCAYLTGTSYWTGFTPSPTVVVISVAGTAVVGVVLLLPRLRHALGARIRPYLRGVLPRLLDMLQSPSSLLLGFGGTLLITAAFVLCLQFSVLAFADPGAQVSLVAVAVVFLAGNAIGSAAPTPGGLGAVEAALIGGLTTVAGVPAAVALPAVLLFRLLTFWLPVLPGWGAFSYLQRREAI
ncbi:flippase-like domain-containing protein [Nocardiopsis dassonvillei]|uniref:lysylphosphatidylglycerol synthase transmembrane domain-containing protein n=1 Tax=Nocardiopsis dassonvillei TaxID=2014 RepID=UPI00200C833E|nr:lysylphosphatidylglycerol synthase transmembrane domain-containing protein [Nocardiopsis dassonvillei]MCK9868373.1 flippase-like domain-containing protein [Nocardiopsis dassonvillei]